MNVTALNNFPLTFDLSAEMECGSRTVTTSEFSRDRLMKYSVIDTESERSSVGVFQLVGVELAFQIGAAAVRNFGVAALRFLVEAAIS